MVKAEEAQVQDESAHTADCFQDARRMGYKLAAAHSETPSDMKRAAIGVRMHSGWGALVAVSNSDGRVEILERRRVAMTIPGTPGAQQPYHFAENLKLPEAENFLGNCFATSK